MFIYRCVKVENNLSTAIANIHFTHEHRYIS